MADEEVVARAKAGSSRESAVTGRGTAGSPCRGETTKSATAGQAKNAPIYWAYATADPMI
jgi:hypothetical protein